MKEVNPLRMSLKPRFLQLGFTEFLVPELELSNSYFVPDRSSQIPEIRVQASPLRTEEKK